MSSPFDRIKQTAYGLPGVRELVERHREVVRERDALRRQVQQFEADRHINARVGAFRPGAEFAPLSDAERKVVDDFHRLYYERWQAGQDTINIGWFGFRTLKCPMDLWTYQEIIAERRPDIIIETGTRFGGSAYYLASLCQLLDNGQVISVDIDATVNRPEHPRITYLTGSSTADDIVAEVRGLAVEGERVMIILDSDHSQAHVEAELAAYADLVTEGDYLIVEDTNVNGHPTYPEFGPGPMEAVQSFLQSNPGFAPDERCERFLMTLNPRGFLRRNA